MIKGKYAPTKCAMRTILVSRFRCVIRAVELHIVIDAYRASGRWVPVKVLTAPRMSARSQGE